MDPYKPLFPFKEADTALATVGNANKQIAVHQVKGSTLTPEETKMLYDTFNDTYSKAVGSAKGEDWFSGRAKNWVFWGSSDGYVATREQKSTGALKLVAIAGEQKLILKAFVEILRTGKAIWGAVDKNVSKILQRVGFVEIPDPLLSTLFGDTGLIPQNTVSAYPVTANGDGTLTIFDEELKAYYTKRILVNQKWVKTTIAVGEKMKWPDGVLVALKNLGQTGQIGNSALKQLMGESHGKKLAGLY